MNKHLWLSSTKAPSAGCLHAWLHAVGDPRIRPQVEPDKVSLCQAEVMNLSPPPPFTEGFRVNLITSLARQQNKSSRDRGEVKRCVFMKCDTAIGGHPFESSPCQTWSCSTQLKQRSVCRVCARPSLTVLPQQGFLKCQLPCKIHAQS